MICFIVENSLSQVFFQPGLVQPLADDDAHREAADITLKAVSDFANRLLYYPTTTREESPFMGRITDNLTSGKVFADLGLPAMDAANDRAMICGSLAFNTDVKTVLEGFGLHEGANSDPKEFVVEKAFVGDGI